MSDVVGNALIQIEPDFSGFEAQLTRGLTAAVERAQKAATVKLQVDVQQKQVQQFEKSMGGADKVSQALEGHLSEVNRTLGQVSAQLATTNASIAQLSRIMYELAVNSRQAAKETGGPLAKAFETLGAVTRIVETITRVAANVATIVGFSKQIKKLGSTFKEEAQNAVGFMEHFRALGKALDKTFTEEQQKGMRNFSAGAHGAADAAHGMGNAMGSARDKFAKGKKVVEEQAESVKSFARANISAIESTSQFGAAQEVAIKKMGLLRTLLGKTGAAAPKAPDSGKLIGKASDFAAQVPDLGKAIGGKIDQAAPGIKAKLLGLFGGLKQGAQEAVGQTGVLTKSVEDTIVKATPGIKGKLLGLLGGLKGGGDKAFSALGAGAAGATDAIVGLGGTLQASVAHAGLFTRAIEAIGPALASIGHFLTSPITAIKGFFSNLTSAASGAASLLTGVAKGVDGFGGAVLRGAHVFDKLAEPIIGATSKIKDFVQTAPKASVAAAGMATAGFAVAAVGAGILAGKVSELVHQGIQAAAEMEKTKIALKGVFEQTDEAATKSFDKIQKFAALTPFSLQTAANSVTKLKASFKNFSVEDALSVLKDIAAAGATVGAADDQISRAVLAINQIGAKGRLSAEEINQFTEAIPSVSRIGIFDALAAKLGKTTVEVQKLADAGQISGAVGISAILDAARQAPGAATALEKQAASFQGAMSTIKDNFNQVLAVAFTPFLNQLTKGFNQLGPLFAEIKGPIGEFADSLGHAFTAFAPVVGSIVVQFAHLLGSLSPLISMAADLVAVFFGPFQLGLAGVDKALDFVMNKGLRPFVIAIEFMRKAFFGLVSLISSSVGPGLVALGKLIMSALKPAVSGLISLFKTVGSAIASALRPVIDFVRDHFKTLLIPVMLALAPTIITVIAGFMALKAAISVSATIVRSAINLFSALIEVVTVVGGAIGRRIQDGVDIAKAALQAVGRVMVTVGGVIQGVLEFIGGWVLKLGGFFGGLANQAGKFVDMLLNFGPVKAIFDAVGTAISAIGSAFDQIGKKFAFLQKVPLLGRFFKGLGGDAKKTGDSFNSLGLDAKDADAKLAGMKATVINLDTEMGNLMKTAAGFKTIIATIQLNVLTNPAETAMATAQKQIADLGQAVMAPLDPFNSAISAAESVKSAKQQVLTIDKQISDLNKQRTVIQADTTRGAREEFEALQKIRDVNSQIRDLQEEREQLVFDEQRRQAAFAPTLAGFDDQALTASLSLAKAKRDVEDAQKAINDAVKDGIPPEQANLDLAGLTLEQIKSKLTNVRAVMRAQKAAAPKAADAQTPAEKARKGVELQEGLLSSQIALREAERNSLDVAQQKADFLRQSTIAQREYGESVEGLGARETQLNNDKTTALLEHRRLLAGEIGVKAELRGLTEQITTAEKQRAIAVKAVADQQQLAAIASASARGDTAEVLRLTGLMVIEKGKLAGLDVTTQAALQTTIDKYKEQTGQIIALQNAMKQLSPIISATNSELVAQERDPQSAINRILALPLDDPLRQALLTLLAQRFPGFAQGGVVDRATFARVGEAGKEAVLPLTRPARMAELLGRSDVLAPILANLPRIKLPGSARTSLGMSASLSPGPSASPLLVPGRTSTMSTRERIKERKAMADAIAEALAVVLTATGDTHVTVQQSISTQDPHEAAKQAEKKLRRYLNSM